MLQMFGERIRLGCIEGLKWAVGVESQKGQGFPTNRIPTIWAEPSLRSDLV